MIDSEYVRARVSRLGAIEEELANPATAANQKKYRELVQEHAALRRMQEKAERFFALEQDLQEHRDLIAGGESDSELRELARSELEALQSAFASAEKELLLALLPPDETERRGAIMEIRAGTGGEEAALFAADLFRMYGRHAAGKGWKIGIVDASSSSIGGYKDVIFTVEGRDVYGALRYESGVHRVQRVPVTEASGRIHTSAATVAVFPEAEPEDDIEIKPEELRIDIFCSSGPGGQSVNTTYSAIRVTHLPTGMVAQSQDERSQQRNREKAIAVLKARLLDARRQAEEEKMGKTRRGLIGSGDRSERIRTYNFPQNRLTDHRINMTLYSLDRVMEGDIEEVLTALRAQDIDLRLKEAMAAPGA
jgi:peptide chain release factor 1